MKTLRTVFLPAVIAILFTASCKRESFQQTTVSQESQTVTATEQTNVTARGGSSGVCNPNAYVIILESRTFVNGNWEWIWSIRNPNPGNGNNGTVQDLSNWGMQLGSCVAWSSVVGAAYSSNGTDWTSFTPTYEVNPGQGCLTTPVLKFDFGTSGTAKTYYKVIVNQDYAEGAVTGYYKSGSSTSCCTFSFNGIGCGGPVEIVE